MNNPLQRLPPRLRALWRSPARLPLALTAAAGSLWAIAWLDWSAWHLFSPWFVGFGFTAGLLAALYWLHVNRHRKRARRVAATLAFPFLAQWLVFAADLAGLAALARLLAQASLLILFLAGLAWAVWIVERHSSAPPHPAAGSRTGTGLRLRTGPRPRTWNPLKLSAWFYRPHGARLDQSALTFVSYTLAFAVATFLLARLSGCREIYQAPAGGGEERRVPQIVQIQKVLEKKYVINPFGAVLFNPPPVEDVPLQLEELTENLYQIGQGAGDQSGFSGGTPRGKIRFIRLEYEGGDWDQDFGVGADLNMLLEYGIRTGQKIDDRTESRKISQLANFPATKSPPMVYLTGQRNIFVSDREVETLREYLTDKHGMLFADNGGSAGWHAQFFEVMRRVLPDLQPVRVPLDHPVHRTPYAIPFLPYVAPHGGKDAWGWVADGRLVVYYHPGDIGDAWADGHAGVRREIWEYCYQLGTNIIFYAHAQYNRWLDTQDSDAATNP
ncbi:hypothetical protein BH23VER1_BH23VER1_05290 [soil metagenome]